MARTRKILLYAILLLMTIGYSWMIDLGISGFRVFVSQKPYTALPLLTHWLSMRQLPWQLLAFASLLINFFWALHGEKRNADGRAHLYAAVLHAGWLQLCLIAHMLGMLLPFIAKAYIIR